MSRSRELERERKQQEFRTYGRQYTKEPVDFTDTLRQISKTVRQNERSDQELSFELKRREREREAKHTTRKVYERKAEYFEIQGWYVHFSACVWTNLWLKERGRRFQMAKTVQGQRT